MFERMIGGVVGMIGSYIEKKKLLGMYTEDQRQVMAELERHYMEEMDHEWQSSASSLASSTHSPAASAFRRQPVVGYFEKLEKRFEQDEFFKKEEFDL